MMNRYMVGMALALLLVAGDSLAAQTRGHIEYRNGRIDVGVNIGGLPVRVSPHGPTARGWVAADWGPVRIRFESRQPFVRQGTLHRQDLRYLLGKEMVRDIERHAKRMGIRGKTRGHWFRADRNTTVLEVTVDRIPVAELHDYRSDGVIDEFFLTGPRQRAWYGAQNHGRYENWNDNRRTKERKPR